MSYAMKITVHLISKDFIVEKCYVPVIFSVTLEIEKQGLLELLQHRNWRFSVRINSFVENQNR